MDSNPYLLPHHFSPPYLPPSTLSHVFFPLLSCLLQPSTILFFSLSSFLSKSSIPFPSSSSSSNPLPSFISQSPNLSPPFPLPPTVARERLDQLEGHPDYYIRSSIRVIPLDCSSSSSSSLPCSLGTPSSGADTAALDGVPSPDDAGDSLAGAVVADCYFLRHFDPKLLRLPCLESFEFESSEYPRYVPPRERAALDVYNARRDVMLKEIDAGES